MPATSSGLFGVPKCRRGIRAYAALFVSAHTGMRRGEILGLRWADVDLDHARLSVRQALVSVAYDKQLLDVKTGAGRRTIDLDERTIAVLRRWRRRQAEKPLLGTGYSDHDLVFCRADGDPIHPDLFSQTFDRAAAKSGLPEITLHDLRHTHASLLLKAGVPVKVVSERLGHSNLAFTMSVYQHVIPACRRKRQRSSLLWLRMATRWQHRPICLPDSCLPLPDGPVQGLPRPR